MTIKERIKQLCKDNGISMNQLEKELGFAVGYISKLDKSTPNSRYIQRIADRFNVSVDYLMTGKEPEFSADMAKTDVELSMMDARLKTYALKMSQLNETQLEALYSIIDTYLRKER